MAEVRVTRSETNTDWVDVRNSAGPFVNQPVAIVGMHRSGTSMVAKLLKQAGLNLGPDSELMPPAEENPEGFFEHLEFVRLNDEVLNAAGAGWDCPPPSGFDWQAEALEPFRDRARMLAAALQDEAPWGWKDPRTSLTLPFWRSALGPLRIVAVVRNPLEVVTSLHRRNGFSMALSLTLWRLYAERLLEDTTSEERLITHYDAYFLEPEREIDRVLAFIGVENAEQASSLRAAAVIGLRHHRKTARDLEENSFPPEVTDLYRQLSHEAQWWEGGKTASDTAPRFSPGKADTIARGAGAVDLLRVENVALRRNIDDLTAAIAGRDLRVDELEMALRSHEVARAELEAKVAERENRIHERHQVLMRKDHAISGLQQQIAHFSAELSRLREQMTELSERLAESERGRAIGELHERELREMNTRLQEVQLQRDAEIMGTLGAVLSRHAPGAPASIYHRRLVDQIRRQVDKHLPPDSSVLVATYGDPAMLQLGQRQAEPFPRPATGISANYTDISDDDAIAQLNARREAGAEFLVVPGPALPWLTNHPGLERHLDERHAVVARERGVVTIYALGRQQGQIPA